MVFVFLTVGGVYQDRNMRSRVSYALAQTGDLKQQVAAFHAREQRWPRAADLGVAEWVPYAEGGGYRLQAEGTIRISFTVLRGLKGFGITLRFMPADDGKSGKWRCEPDAGLRPHLLPGECRDWVQERVPR